MINIMIPTRNQCATNMDSKTSSILLAPDARPEMETEDPILVQTGNN